MLADRVYGREAQTNVCNGVVIYIGIVLKLKSFLIELKLLNHIRVQLLHCSLSCESWMCSGLTLVLSHFLAASRTSLSDLFIQLWASLTAQAIMGKLYILYSLLNDDSR
jgi:hypothetical protein